MTIKKGNTVTLDYEGKFENGEVFDSSKHGDHSHPLIFEAGAGEVIAGFDQAVIGMEKGQEKEFSIEAKDAYGEYNPELLKKIPKSSLPKGKEPEKGMALMMRDPASGMTHPIMIAHVDKDEVTLDFNHPLAGKKLIFKIKILDIA